MTIEDLSDARADLFLALRDLVEFAERVLARFREDVRCLDLVGLDGLRPDGIEREALRVALLRMTARKQVIVGCVVGVFRLAVANEIEEGIHAGERPLLAPDSGSMARRERASAATIDGLQHSEIDLFRVGVSVLLVVLVDFRLERLLRLFADLDASARSARRSLRVAIASRDALGWLRRRIAAAVLRAASARLLLALGIALALTVKLIALPLCPRKAVVAAPAVPRLPSLALLVPRRAFLVGFVALEIRDHAPDRVLGNRDAIREVTSASNADCGHAAFRFRLSCANLERSLCVVSDRLRRACVNVSERFRLDVIFVDRFRREAER